jgi:Subtilase family
LAVAALAAVVALPAGASTRAPDALAAAACAKETKRVKAFQRGMKAAKRRHFRSHRSAKSRKRFVRRQNRKLAQLKRARRQCLTKPPAVGTPLPTGGNPPPAVGTPPPTGGNPPPPPPPAPLATTAITDVVSDRARFADDEVEIENGVEFVRTQLELELTPDATVAHMEALLARLNAEVVSSLAGVGILTVRIPDPGSLPALRDLVAGLAGQPGLASADLATVPGALELPSIVGVGDVSPVRPQLASRAAAAWNVRGALSGTMPTLLIGDFFGAGPPGAEVAVQETAADFGTNNPLAHGYTILGLAAAAFEPAAGLDLATNQVTGMWPGPDLPLRVVDLRLRIAGSTAQDRLLQVIHGTSGDVVVNTSFEDGCARAGCSLPQIQGDALQWIQRVRGSGLEDRFLHVSAAGNIYSDVLTDTQGARGSAFNHAALASLPGGVTNLSNTIVVEDTTASDPAAGPVVPLCLTATSKRGGHISAVGNDIKSFSAPGVFRDLPAGGTSSAAPQVAGAAATVWALAPSLTPAQLAGILRTTARPVTTTTGDSRCGSVQAAPALDAYAAVLAADGAMTKPVRAEILDADGDGAFDEQDLQAFRDAFIGSGQDGVIGVDYSRHDLNGDGLTGGGRDRYDLDASSPPAWTFSQRRDVLGLEVLHDENDVRDLDILCHEAHGPLYNGTVAARDLFAEEFCLPPVELEVDPPFPASLTPGQSAQLRIRARRTDLSDPTVSQQPGVHLDFQLDSGAMGAPSGTTGLDGTFSTSAGLGPTGGFEVEVIARAGPGGPELDRLTVTAARAGPVTLMEGQTFLVANAEGDDDVEENEASPNYTGSVSAADQDATASGTLSTTFGSSAAGFTFTGMANINAADDGGGGDASALFTWRFIVNETMFFRFRGTLQGDDPEETFGRLSLGFTGSPNPFYNLTAFDTDDFGGQFAPGDYTITAEVGCSPGNEGGPCSGSFNLDLDVGDFITP